MTRFVRNSIASTSLAILALIAAGCGGGDDAVTVVDAATDAATDAPADAPPLVCNAPTMNCGGECVNTNTDEQHCGDCTTVCTGGQVCNGSCACPTVTVPTNPSGGLGVELQGVLFSTNTLSGNAFIVAVSPSTLMLDTDYVMSDTLGIPLVGFGINVDVLNMTADATYAATEGTLRVTKTCPDDPNTQIPEGGIMGTITDVKFSAVDGLLSGNPVIVQGGCTLPPTGTIPSISFSLGNTSCVNQ